LGLHGENARRVLVVAIAAASLVSAVAGTAYGGMLQETEPTPTVPTPAPDPAPPPPPKPAPKPVAKATPKPAPVYHAPTPARAPEPRYTAPRTVYVAPKKIVRPRKHVRQVEKKKPVVVTPKPKAKPTARVKSASIVRVPAAAVTTNYPGDAARRAAVIGGMGFSALLFFVVLTVPATRMRYTAPGRVLMDHQIDLVLTGVAVLMLTGLLFYVTGTSS
jgi:hypothetical protein